MTRFGSQGEGDVGTGVVGQPASHWFSELDGKELRPVDGYWRDAPVRLFADCPHNNVVANIKVGDGVPASASGRIALYCFSCDSTWWESLSNIIGSPFASK